MIIWGWGGSRPTDFGPAVPLTCPNCHNDTVFHYVSAASWFSIFFIRLIPYHRRHMLLCPICTRGVTLSPEQATRAKALASARAALGPTPDPAAEAAVAADTQSFLALLAPVELSQAEIDSQRPQTPNWYPDPYRRHQVRYWDGARWTEHVADRGDQQVDPPPAP